jgi:hypothetical protein
VAISLAQRALRLPTQARAKIAGIGYNGVCRLILSGLHD